MKQFINLLILVLIFGILGILASCTDNPNDPSDTNNVYPIPDQIEDGWGTASIPSVGLKENQLLQMLTYLQDTPGNNIHSIVIVKNSKLVIEEYFSGDKFNLGQYTGETGFDREDTHNLCSATKSLVSACLGIAIDKGFIQSVNQEIYNFFPEHSDIFQSNPLKQTITIKHLLTMSSGIEWDYETYYYNDPRNDLYQLFTRNNPIRYILSKEITEIPGTVFAYMNCNTNLLGEIICSANLG